MKKTLYTNEGIVEIELEEGPDQDIIFWADWDGSKPHSQDCLCADCCNWMFQ
jgi:hypothetical protein